MEKNKLYEILRDWNIWDREVDVGILREPYIKNIERLAKTGEIIVIKGIRRSGKSTIARQYQKKLDKKHTLFVNFEDPRLPNDASILAEIFDVYKEKINPNKKPFLFLDEVQNIPGWEKWARTIYELKKADIIVTGSSSKLLSKEIGTALSGRVLQKIVYPLSFREFLLFKGLFLKSEGDILDNKIKIKRRFEEYLKYGGFPKVALIEDEYNKRNELISYFESIIIKDIVARYEIKNYENLKKITKFLLSNIAKVHNLNKIKNYVGISYESTVNYVEYLKEVFLIFELTNYDYSLKKQFKSFKKYYSIDAGLINAVGFNFSRNIGRLYENLVFIELIRNNEEIYYWRGRNEIDFLIKKKHKIKEAIQVCYDIEDPATKDREFKGLLEAMDKFKIKKGTVITSDKESTELIKGKKINFMPLWKWLLQ